jgi:predicted ATPase with chaperone activity
MHLLDRIDIHIEVPRVAVREADHRSNARRSMEVRARLRAAD